MRRLVIVGRAAPDIWSYLPLLEEASGRRIEVLNFAAKGSKYQQECAKQAQSVKSYETSRQLCSACSGADAVIFLHTTAKPEVEAIEALRKAHIRTGHVQIGLLRDPYTPVLPVPDFFFSFGTAWDRLIAAHNPEQRCVAVGSLKVDWLKKRRATKYRHVLVVGQHINVPGSRHTIPGFSWTEYLETIRDFFNERFRFGHFRIIFRPHPSYGGTELPVGVGLSHDFMDVAHADTVVTLYSTLGLEAAAASISTISFVPCDYPLVLDMSRYGVKTVRSLDDLWGLPVCRPFEEWMHTGRDTAAKKILDTLEKPV